MDHLNLLSGLDKRTYPLVEMAERNSFENIRDIWICSDGIHYHSTGVTLQSIPNHSNRGTFRPSMSSSTGHRWKIFRIPQYWGTDGNILHERADLWESHWDRALYLWWAVAKRNKTGIIFRVGKSNLTTQIINLKSHFMLPQWTQMLHFTLGKRYF